MILLRKIADGLGSVAAARLTARRFVKLRLF
jgi:hypothetical protein